MSKEEEDFIIKSFLGTLEIQLVHALIKVGHLESKQDQAKRIIDILYTNRFGGI